MRARTVCLVGLTLFLLAGCSSNSSKVNSSDSIRELQKEACEEWAEGISSNTFQWMPMATARKFQRIAEANSDYLQLSRAAFVLNSLNSSEIKYNSDAIKTLFIESISEVTRLCTSDEFTSEKTSPSPSPSGS
jgi:hypothetical protein